MKQFYSHAGVFKGRVIPPKLLKVHTWAVTEKGLERFSTNVFKADYRPLFKNIGLYHDLGKYTPYFQAYLLNTAKVDPKLKRHAMFGAYVLCQKYLLLPSAAMEAMLGFFIIRHHHSDLSNFDSIKSLVRKGEEEMKLFQKQLDSLYADRTVIAEEIQEIDLENWLQFPEEKIFSEQRKVFYRDLRSIEHYFVINYLFSLLIESDKLDASETPSYLPGSIKTGLVDRFVAQFQENPLRNLVRTEVVARIKSVDAEQCRLFTLTAPTGVGKTLTALDAALHLRQKIPALKNGQIIYALPFINIIEQSLEVYQNVFDGENVHILAHYQYSDVFNGDPHLTDPDGELTDYHQKVMALDTWQSDIVITSFVQLLHTLIGSRNKLLKKFNHFADSIIIMDEVQTLRLDLLPLVGAALLLLTKYLNARVIMMTATKPEIMPLAFEKILQKEGFEEAECTPVELLTNFKDIFSQYKRTRIVPLLGIPLDQDTPEARFVSDIFSVQWSAAFSCLIVVNTVNRSIQLFEALNQFLSENGLDNPMYCLSTNIVPAHRLEKIEQIRSDLKNGRKPILVATQVVEAGVDLDFDMGFRDLGPIDSIVQVAGRINRQTDPIHPAVAHKPLYIIDFKDCERIYGTVTDRQARKVFEGVAEVPESRYLDIVSNYFKETSATGAVYSKSIEVFDCMKALRYEDLDEKFQVIEERPNTVSVFVLCDPKAYVVKENFERWQKKEIEKEVFEREFKRDFQQRIITVPRFYTEHLSDISKDIKLAEAADYDIQTGFIRTKSSSKTFCL